MKNIIIKVPVVKPRDINFKDMLHVKNQAFVDRKKKKNREICRKKVEAE